MFIKKAINFLQLYAFIPLFFVALALICYIPEIFIARDFANSSFAESWDNSIASLPETPQYLGVYTEKTMYSPTRHVIFCDTKDNNVTFFAVDARGLTYVSYSQDEIECVDDSQLVFDGSKIVLDNQNKVFNYKNGTEDTPYTIDFQEACSYKNYWARDLYMLEDPNVSFIAKMTDESTKKNALIFEKRSGKRITLFKLDDIGLHEVDNFYYEENVSYSKESYNIIYVKVDDTAYLLKYQQNELVFRKR